MQNKDIPEAEDRFTSDNARWHACLVREKAANDRIAELQFAKEQGIEQGIEQEREAKIADHRTLPKIADHRTLPEKLGSRGPTAEKTVVLTEASAEKPFPAIMRVWTGHYTDENLPAGSHQGASFPSGKLCST